jgi:hypothetical protein
MIHTESFPRTVFDTFQGGARNRVRKRKPPETHRDEPILGTSIIPKTQSQSKTIGDTR